MQDRKPKYRDNLPQLSSDIFMTSGGTLTTFIFKYNIDIPHLATFPLLYNDKGYEAILKYNATYVALARKYEVGIILENDSWRANPDWGRKLGYSPKQLAEANHKSIKLLWEIRDKYETPKTPIVISACIGPREDAYKTAHFMSAKEAEEYHFPQINNLSESSADMISALTINYAEEAIGIVNAAKSANIPVVISFTLETDGKLPSGQSLKEAIEKVDAETNSGPIYYMINCVHPIHFKDVLIPTEKWTQRVRGIRANASKKSHAELNECETLDEGDPKELGYEYGRLVERLTSLVVVGGCCGTDHNHVEEIIKASLAVRRDKNIKGSPENC